MVTEVTRRAIVDQIVGNKISWAGRLPEEEFLSRLYDLIAMPSHDHRHRNAAGDIFQHRTNWTDWEDDWIFYDRRFNLLRCPDEEFLHFLVETVHPVVQPDEEVVSRLVEMYNKELGADGWELVGRGEISGRPIYRATRREEQAEVFVEPTGWARVDRQMGEIRLRLSEATAEEHFQGVGHLCREALISLAQAVYDREKHPTLDKVEASATDAKRMLEAYIAVELPGSGNADGRKHARAALDFANSVQHDQAASFLDAALCVEATLSVVRVIALVAGRRERAGLAS
jgi:hypothetical protein